jgi:UDP-3-O-[3-hydroxymyristoyl] glucosamine N-acyltransferase
VEGAILWANGRVGPEAVVGAAIGGRHVHVGRGATVAAGAVLGDKTALTDYSKV